MASGKPVPSHGWTPEAVERSRIMAGPDGKAYSISGGAIIRPFVIYARSAREAAWTVQINRRPFYRMRHYGIITATALDDCDDSATVEEDELMRGRSGGVE